MPLNKETELNTDFKQILSQRSTYFYTVTYLYLGVKSFNVVEFGNK